LGHSEPALVEVVMSGEETPIVAYRQASEKKRAAAVTGR